MEEYLRWLLCFVEGIEVKNFEDEVLWKYWLFWIIGNVGVGKLLLMKMVVDDVKDNYEVVFVFLYFFNVCGLKFEKLIEGMYWMLICWFFEELLCYVIDEFKLILGLVMFIDWGIL